MQAAFKDIAERSQKLLQDFAERYTADGPQPADPLRLTQTFLDFTAKMLADPNKLLQAQLDLFRLIYNHHRPHRGIDRQRPADVWATAPKSGPGKIVRWPWITSKPIKSGMPAELPPTMAASGSKSARTVRTPSSEYPPATTTTVPSSRAITRASVSARSSRD